MLKLILSAGIASLLVCGASYAATPLASSQLASSDLVQIRQDMTIAIATGIVMPIARTTGVIAAASRPVQSGIARRQSEGPAAR